MFWHMHIHTHTHTHTHTNKNTHKHTHTHTCVQRKLTFFLALSHTHTHARIDLHVFSRAVLEPIEPFPLVHFAQILPVLLQCVAVCCSVKRVLK